MSKSKQKYKNNSWFYEKHFSEWLFKMMIERIYMQVVLMYFVTVQYGKKGAHCPFDWCWT